MGPAVVDTVKVEAARQGTSPGEIIASAIREKLPMLYRSMVRRLKEGA